MHELAFFYNIRIARNTDNILSCHDNKSATIYVHERQQTFIKDVTIYFLLLLLLYKMVMLALHEHQIKTAD